MSFTTYWFKTFLLKLLHLIFGYFSFRSNSENRVVEISSERIGSNIGYFVVEHHSPSDEEGGGETWSLDITSPSPDIDCSGIFPWFSEHRCDINVKDSRGRSPLHYAADKGNPQVVNLLIQSGRDKSENLDH